MYVLADTNILIRGVHRRSAKHRDALRALRALRDRGDRLCVAAQNLYEFWAVATRPIESNGLGLTATEAARITSRIEAFASFFAISRRSTTNGDDSSWNTLSQGKRHTMHGWWQQ